MSEMVERVARAIWERRVGERPWATLPERTKFYWVDMARDAIAAMRDPTDWMELMGTRAWLRGRDREDRSRACWQAMIDAALNEADEHDTPAATPDAEQPQEPPA